jgi:hypothetical protein
VSRHSVVIIALVFYVFLVGVSEAQQPAAVAPAISPKSQASTPAQSTVPPARRVIIKVGSTAVTQADFESGIGDIEPQGDADKEGPSDDKDRRKLGDDYVSVLMLSQRAVANHLDTSPEVTRQLAIDRMQILSDAEFNRLMGQAKPSFAEVGTYYSDHLADYDEVRIRRLFIWKRGEGSKKQQGLSPEDARTRADAVLQASAAGRDTSKLTESFKDSNDGIYDAQPITFPRGELPPEIEKAAFTIKDGEWAQAQDTADSIILVQLVKRDHRQLGQVSSQIETKLQGEKMQAMLDDLKKDSGIWMDDEYFGTVAAPVPGAQQRVSKAPSTNRQSTTKGEVNHEGERQK